MVLVYAYSDRGMTRDIGILNAAGNVIVPGGNDQIQAMIGRVGEEPKLSVTSGSPTVAGSSFTKNSPSAGLNRLRLDATDLAAIEPGTYTFFTCYYDFDDDAEWKVVSRQVIQIEDT